MKCLVLGGGGFIGSAVTDRLLRDGHVVRVLVRHKTLPYRVFNDSEPLEWMRGDFENIEDLRQAICGVDVVFHLISSTTPKSSNDDMVHDIGSNQISTVRFLQLLHTGTVQKVVFISSGGTVYGVPQYLPITEVHPTNPIVSYGITKLAIEKYINMSADMYGFKSVILRLSNPYGPRQRVETAQGVIAAFLHHVLLGKPVEIWGAGNTTRDYIHIDDVGSACAKAIAYNGSEKIFNLSTGVGTSLNGILDIIGKIIGKPVDIIYKQARGFDVPVNILDNTLISKSFDWSPEISIEDGLIQTISALKILGDRS